MTSAHTLNRLIRKANQAAAFFAHLPEDEAVAETANHLKSFWEPRLRASIREYLAQHSDGGELKPIAQKAVETL